ARAVKCRCHLDLTVHTLLAHDRHARADAAPDEGRAHVISQIEAEFDELSRSVRVHARSLLFLGAGRVVAQGLHAEGCLRPQTTQCHARAAYERALAAADGDALTRDRAPDFVYQLGEPVGREGGAHLLQVARAHFEHGAELLAEQYAGVV